MKKILIIHGHPVRNTFSDKLTDSYIAGATSSGAQIREIRLSALKFNLNFTAGYRGRQDMEPDLVEAQKLIEWAEHLVFFYPNWWSTFPALVKGFIDRTFLPGWAFSYRKGNQLPVKLLKGRSARVVVTMDSPPWYYYWILRSPGHHAMKYGILHFCGIKPVRITTIGSIRNSTEHQRLKWLEKLFDLGEKMV